MTDEHPPRILTPDPVTGRCPCVTLGPGTLAILFGRRP